MRNKIFWSHDPRLKLFVLNSVSRLKEIGHHLCNIILTVQYGGDSILLLGVFVSGKDWEMGQGGGKFNRTKYSDILNEMMKNL